MRIGSFFSNLSAWTYGYLCSYSAVQGKAVADPASRIGVRSGLPSTEWADYGGSEVWPWGLTSCRFTPDCQAYPFSHILRFLCQQVKWREWLSGSSHEWNVAMSEDNYRRLFRKKELLPELERKKMATLIITTSKILLPQPTESVVERVEQATPVAH